ncbi:unnamed protein product [Phyllotreta striolata]|uniref:Phosphoglycolate phosphatase n=1 Tax=Phyllotreta striolata TaxID=444603 RepID=A0A9N9XJT7_PHYSR|nr:unnamed protein product [Phyllotreta striolata]
MMNKLLGRPQDLTKMSPDDVKLIINKFDTIITDCDGVLWIENKPITGSIEAYERLVSIGKKVILISNTSILSRKELRKKASDMGFPEVPLDNIITTSYLVADYLHLKNFSKKAYVIGSQGIADEMAAKGIRHAGVGPDALQFNLVQAIERFAPDAQVGAVVVGFDEHFCYNKLLKAASYLSEPSCLFLGTNKEERFKIHASLVIPGTGSILAALESTVQRQATIVGKPYPFLREALKSKHRIVPERTLVIGDRTNTDVKLSKECKFESLLVKSGAPNYLSLNQQPENGDHVPDFHIDKLGDLVDCLD